MEQIQNRALLARLLQGQPFAACFDTLPAGLSLRRYAKGELLNAPFRPQHDFLLVLQGKTRIYGVREDGSDFSVSMEERGAFLGDLEFCCADFVPFYVEAVSEVLCAALPMEAHRAELEENPRFLRFLLRTLTEKFMLTARLDRPAKSLEERVLTFLREMQADHSLHSVNEGVSRLHCSRSQLQRVLRRLCADGALQRTGKGEYRLCRF